VGGLLEVGVLCLIMEQVLGSEAGSQQGCAVSLGTQANETVQPLTEAGSVIMGPNCCGGQCSSCYQSKGLFCFSNQPVGAVSSAL
jgi:hypothetical protein